MLFLGKNDGNRSAPHPTALSYESKGYIGINEMIREHFYIIANSIKPYAFETAKVLALPAGCKFKARFTRKWIQQDILSYTSQMIGKTGIYILRDWKKDILIPIRNIIIEKVTSLGDIVIINYMVGDYIDYSGTKEGRAKQLDTFNSSFFDDIDELKPTRGVETAMSPLVFTSNSDIQIKNFSAFETSKDSAISEKWLNTIYNLENIELFQGMSFVLPMIYSKSNDLIIADKKNKITLYPNKDYIIEILHYIIYNEESSSVSDRHKSTCNGYMPYGPYVISLISPIKGISLSPKELTATGRYDGIKSFISIDANVTGICQLIVEPTIPTFAKDSYDPKIYIDLYIPLRTISIFTQAFLFTIFFATYICIEFLDLLNKKQFPTLTSFLSDLSMVLFTIKLLSFIDKVKQLILEFWWHK